MSIAAAPVPTAPNPRRRWSGAILRFVATQPLGSAGLVMIAMFAAAAVFSDAIAPYDPEAISFLEQLKPPSLQHFFGTDPFGRDIFSRIVYGSRTALAVGFISAFAGCIIGAVIGAGSAYFGGRVDLIIQRLIDIMLSLPIVVLALIIIAVVQELVLFDVDFNVVAAIAIPFIPRAARVLRAAALSVVRLPYIDAARAAGFSAQRIIFRHVLPNVAAPFIILLTAFIGQAILLEATLSFLGLGVSEPTPAWGLMLSGQNADYYRSAPWMIIFPGLAISLAVFSFNLVGDSLRDWLDPKLQL